MKKINLTIISFIFLFTTISYSQIWTEQVSNVTTPLTSVSSGDGNSAWVCGNSGTVLRTTNSGINWLNVSGNGIPSTVSLINIFGIDANTALVAGYITTTTYVYRTSNAGATWTQVFTQTGGGFIDAMWMRTNLLGFMVGDPVGSRWALFKTSNGGLTWDSTGMYLPQAGSETGYNNSLCYLTPRIWFGTNNTRIYYSSNDGASWVSRSTAPEVNSYAVYFCQAWGGNTGLLGGATLMLSNDTGATWTTSTSAGTGNFSGFTGYGVPVDWTQAFQQGKYARSSTGIYSSLFTPNSWNVEYNAPAGNYQHFAEARNSTVSWGVRSNGGITRCTCPISGISNISGEIPKSYNLQQNYPNPFNPSTNIEFSIPGMSNVKLVIYNSLGQMVTQLVDETLSSGKYLVNWDSKDMASGIYFYSLLATENDGLKYVETKKMALVK